MVRGMGSAGRAAVAIVVVAGLAACGGGGGTSAPRIAAISPGGGTPIPDDPGTSAPGCSIGSYQPNYLGDAADTRVHYWIQFPLRYTIKNDWNPDGRSMAQLVRQGIADWAGQTGGAVSLTEVPIEASPDIQIEFVDTITGFPNALGVTEYNVVTSGGSRSRAISRDPGDDSYLPVRIRLKRDTDYLDRQPDFLRQTAFHEIGHVLFIGGHSLTPTDAMFASLNPRLPVPNITARDLNSLYAAYCGVFRWSGRAPQPGLRPGERVERRVVACEAGHCHPVPTAPAP